VVVAAMLCVGISQCWWSGDMSAGMWSSGSCGYVMVVDVGVVIVPENRRCSRCCVGCWVHWYSWLEGRVYRHCVLVEWYDCHTRSL
jgi:hypothetical protein